MDSQEDRNSAPAALDGNFRFQYETLRSLLYRNGTVLKLMSDLEADLGHFTHSDPGIQQAVGRLVEESQLMAQELNLLSGDRHERLQQVVAEISDRIQAACLASSDSGSWPLGVTLDAEEATAPGITGGKASSLATIRRLFPDLVPASFALTTAAYQCFLDESGLADRIRQLLQDLDALASHPRFPERTSEIRDLVLNAPLPDRIQETMEQLARSVAPGVTSWAVRSSAVHEGDEQSFAGQFDSVLRVAPGDLAQAYRSVLASRFSDRAVLYRLHFGFREVDTPMAVLFTPMIEARCAGVIYTRDPQDPDSSNMVLSAVSGLADHLVRGEEEGELHSLPRPSSAALPSAPAPSPSRIEASAERVLSEASAARIAEVAAAVSEAMGYEMDLEWAVDGEERLWLLQGRRLHMPEPRSNGVDGRRSEPPLLEGGYTLFPGRAEGPVERVPEMPGQVLSTKAPVLVVEQGTPILAPLLPKVAAVLIGRGSAVGHLATLIREFQVPSVYGLGSHLALLRSGEVVSVDAADRSVYRGSCWPGVRGRSMARVASTRREGRDHPLEGLILPLNLTDPYASAFKARNCRSLHDVVRFSHEMAVRSMFRLGDRQNRFWNRRVRQLHTRVPIKLRLIDLDACTPSEKKKLEPGDVQSVPFQALWRGVADPRLSWDPKPIQDHMNMPRGFTEQVLGGGRGPRRPRDANYVIVARDYLNLNARFAFHYAMIDAIIGPGREKNHVHFRLRGGGGSQEQRTCRARFLELVLRNFHFGVDRRGDLVTAWLRNHPQNDSENALAMLGRLMACSRQLDMFLSDENMITEWVEWFLAEDYSRFR